MLAQPILVTTVTGDVILTDEIRPHSLSKFLKEHHATYNDFDVSGIPEEWGMERRVRNRFLYYLGTHGKRGIAFLSRFNLPVGRRRWHGFEEGSREWAKQEEREQIWTKLLKRKTEKKK